MKSYQKILALVLALVLSLSLAACAAKTETAASTETASTETASDETASDAVESKGTITVAASPTPHAEILAQVKDTLAEQGIDKGNCFKLKLGSACKITLHKFHNHVMCVLRCNIG